MQIEQILIKVEEILCKRKTNDIIRHKLDEERITVTVLSCAGKTRGRYKTWYNIQNGNGE